MDIRDLLKAELKKSEVQIEVEACYPQIKELQEKRKMKLNDIHRKFFASKVKDYKTFRRWVQACEEPVIEEPNPLDLPESVVKEVEKKDVNVASAEVVEEVKTDDESNPFDSLIKDGKKESLFNLD